MKEFMDALKVQWDDLAVFYWQCHYRVKSWFMSKDPIAGTNLLYEEFRNSFQGIRDDVKKPWWEEAMDEEIEWFQQKSELEFMSAHDGDCNCEEGILCRMSEAEYELNMDHQFKK